jgi:isopentenyl diphosphate isomerase/L-lactate dehydrogenase-like FMN-dependent dehydrogenase
MTFSSVAAAEKIARKRLPQFLVAYKYQGGGEGWTNRENHRAFTEIGFLRKAAVPYKGPPELKTTVLGCDIAMPVIIAPTGMTRLDHPDGDMALCRAASAEGTVCSVSMFSGHTIEKLASEAVGPKWQQLYWSFGRDGASDVMDRASRCGYKALIVTVDLPWAPSLAFNMPRRNLRSAIQFGPQVLARPRWLLRFAAGLHLDPALALRPQVGNHEQTMSPSWDDIAWVRQQWKGPLIIKGILDCDDARRAVAAGADAIVVSNHGGQFLDGVSPTIKVLGAIVAAVGSDTTVLFDGGIRQGSDIAKALALGARAVFVGRAPLFGLAIAGEGGVRQILRLLRTELQSVLSFLGCPSVAALDSTYVSVPDAWLTESHVNPSAGAGWSREQ